MVHVWLQCYENALNTALDTNYSANPNADPDPAPSHINFVSEETGVFRVLFFNWLTTPKVI